MEAPLQIRVLKLLVGRTAFAGTSFGGRSDGVSLVGMLLEFGGKSSGCGFQKDEESGADRCGQRLELTASAVQRALEMGPEIPANVGAQDLLGLEVGAAAFQQ